ncbi:MAG TPA: LLM class flavin-dependent oxidoreductase [Myxococcota bacterium]|nr:LLM class flavin-dependent oxidoreductase [Myxococcota bacterium]
MDFGIALATTTDSWRAVKRAEALGFTHAWFYDTQLLNPDVFVGMALAARETKRIRLGTGVLIPSNRIAPVAANGLATLAKLAPGRIDFGIGTGFTARRTMGQGAVKLGEMERYVNVVQAMLRGDTVECQLDDGPHKVRFLNPDLGLIDISQPIPLHVSAFGPKARALTAKLGAAWLMFAGGVDAAVGALRGMQETWRAERGTAPLYSTLFTLGCVLRKGESPTSERALAQGATLAAAFLHDLVERGSLGEVMGALPPFVAQAAEGYRKLYESYKPDDAKYLTLHRGHLMFLRPDEKPLFTREIMEAFTFTATMPVLRERVAALRDAGYSQLAVQLVEGHEDALDDWAEVLRPFGLRPHVSRAKPAAAKKGKKAAPKRSPKTRRRKR